MMTALKECLIIESEAIRNASENLVSAEVEKVLGFLQNCFKNKSKLIITGVGKSGLVARKISATFTSLGLISLYLNPLDALHGDLGVLESNDLVMLISYSGETSELVELIPHIKNRNVKIFSLLGKKSSTISNSSDAVLDGSVNKEVCPLNLAPTASTAVAMAIGDALAAIFTMRNNISQTDFVRNHPSGLLGKKITLKSSSLMIPIKKIPKINPQQTFFEIVESITNGGYGIGWLSSEEDANKIIGIVTDGDIRRSLKRINIDGNFKIHAKEIMTTNPISIDENLLAIEALKLMESNDKGKSISSLAVLDKDKNILGMIRSHEIIKSGLKI